MKETKKYDCLRIVIANRNNEVYLADCIKSIRKNETVKNNIMIYDDNSGEVDRQWIVDNSDKYDFEYKMINETWDKSEGRLGITKIRNLAMEESPYDVPILWAHSDMNFGHMFDENLLKHVRKGRVVSCTRIEPLIHPAQPKVKILKDFGNSPEEFKEKEFDDFVKKKLVEFKGKVSDGVFAPSCMFKEDYIPIDLAFIPQSKEDCLEHDRPVFVEENGVKKVIFVEDLFNELKKEKQVYNEEEREVIDLSKYNFKTFCVKKEGKVGLSKLNKIWRRKVSKSKITLRTGFGETSITSDHSLIDKNLKSIKYDEVTSNNIWKPKTLSNDLFRRNISHCESFNGVKYEFDEYGNNEDFSDLCLLFGAYCAEGYITLGSKDKPLSVSLSTNDVVERDEYVRLLEKFSNNNIKVYLNKKENYSVVYNIIVHDSGFASELLKNCGRISNKVFVPEMILNVPKSYQELFLFSYLRGDGYIGTTVRKETKKDLSVKVPDELFFHNEIIRKCNLRFTSKSRLLVAGLCYLFKRIFNDININVRWRSEKECYDTTGFFGKKRNNQKIQLEIDENPGERYVYDLEVSRSHTFVDMVGFIALHNSALDYTLKLKGIEFVQVWDSLVYHYGGRGSRNKGDNKDSDEWKRSNNKNLKNFQRIWKEYPRYTETQHPNPPKLRAKIALGVLTKNCESDIIRILNDYEPFFEEFILVDDFSGDNTVSLAEGFMKELKKNSLCANKQLKIVRNDLSSENGTRDFALARNKGVEVCECPWIFWLDADEALEGELINLLNRVAVAADLQKIECVAFARKNFIDGKLRVDTGKDIQCRLHKKSVRWVRPVHEMPEPFYKGLVLQDKESAKKVIISNVGSILHPKTSQRQKEQNKFYDSIMKGQEETPKLGLSESTVADKKEKRYQSTSKIKSSENGHCEPLKRLYCNSVLFSNEGITKHAREELKQLREWGWNIKISDKPKNDSEKEFLSMNENIDFVNDNYVTYINQPPVRPNNPELSLKGNLDKKNIVYFLAYEGDKMPPEWVEVMKDSRIKKVLTPSQHCKTTFESYGIPNVEILHHGIDKEIYKPEGNKLDLPKQLKGKFLYLFVGTYRGTKVDRKGLRVLAKAWKKFKKETNSKNAHLILKLNPVYFNGNKQDWHDAIDDLGLAKSDVTIIDENLSEELFSNLLRSVNCLVAPSLMEGYGFCPLESLCCGTPVIATRTSGMLEYLNDKNSLLINVLRKVSAEEVFPYVGPGWHAEWDLPSTNHLIELLGKVKKDYKKEKEKVVRASKSLRKEYDWNVIGAQFDKILKEIN